MDRLRCLGQEWIPDEPVAVAIHGDLWLQNVLVVGADWCLLDWDELRIGDPAQDYASLLRGPTGRGVDPLADLTVIPTGLPDRGRTWWRRVQRSRLAFTRYRRSYA